MKNSLKYTIMKLDRALLFTINEQSPRLNRFLDTKRNRVYTAKNGWRIHSDRVAEINVKRKVIFLRGSKHNSDNRVDRTMYLPSNNERDSIIKEVKVALAEFVKASKSLPKEKRTNKPYYIGADIIIGFAHLKDVDPKPKLVNSKNLVTL